MQYVLTANGTVGHVITSQSNENATVTTVCGKTLDANTAHLATDVDVCKQCDGKVETLVEDSPDVVLENE